MQKNRDKFSKLILSSLLLASFVSYEAKAEEPTKPTVITSPTEQTETKVPTPSDIAPLKLEGYIDAYYAYDTDASVLPRTFDKRSQNTRPLNAIGFRKNEVNINTAQLTASTNADWYRGKMTVAFGTIAQQSWLPSEYLSLQEANLGFRLAENVWLDGGIFLTHVGGEALLPKNNVSSLLSLTTMFEPFYQGGLKLSYKPVEQFEIQLHALNGYGIIEATNPIPSAGLLLAYTPNSTINLIYSGYAGNPRASTEPAAFRLYNDFNVIYNVTDKFSLRGELDVATQSDIQSVYHSGFVTAHYAFTPAWSVTARGEYIVDEKGMVSAYPNLKDAGLVGGGVTLGGEFKPTANSYVRLEARELFLDSNKNKIFADLSGNPTSNRFEILASTGLWF